MCFWMFQTLFSNVADVVQNVAESHVEPKHQGPMLQTCDVGCCVEGEEGT
jgi:hypothetical protein